MQGRRGVCSGGVSAPVAASGSAAAEDDRGEAAGQDSCHPLPDEGVTGASSLMDDLGVACCGCTVAAATASAAVAYIIGSGNVKDVQQQKCSASGQNDMAHAQKIARL